MYNKRPITKIMGRLYFKFDNQINFERTVVNLDWSFVDVTDGAQLCSLTHELHVQFTNDINLLQQAPNTHVEKQVKITKSAIVIEEAIQAFDQGDEERGRMKNHKSSITSLRISHIPVKHVKRYMNRSID